MALSGLKKVAKAAREAGIVTGGCIATAIIINAPVGIILGGVYIAGRFNLLNRKKSK